MRTNVRVRGLTVRRCASCVRVRFPLLTAMDSHAPLDRNFHTICTHALPCTPIVVRAYRRGGHAPRTRRGVRARARSCVCANACEHFTPPPSVALIGSQAFQDASAFNANIGAWNTVRVTTLYSVCAASGPARTAAECARSVADACAVVVRGGAGVCVCARAHVAKRIRLYVDGSPMDTLLRP